MQIVAPAEATRDALLVVQAQPALRLALGDAPGHVLAEDIVAAIPLPPWTNAGMDGYAVRAADVRGARSGAEVALIVVADVAAGGAPAPALAPGQAARIFTGAQVPDGADSVIRQEDTTRDSARVRIRDDRDAGANVRIAGGDLQIGNIALTAGTAIGPHQLALLAALGVTHPVVHRRPRIGIISTGDELQPLDRPEQILAGERLADVNSPALAALVAEAGGVPLCLGIAKDTPQSLGHLIDLAGDVDFLITAGGVSVGDHDHVRAVMAARHATMRFGRVRVRPGGPTALAVLPDGRAWLALPGNPVSAMVTFELFARPAIRAMCGHRSPDRARISVVLDAQVRQDPLLEQYLRCRFGSSHDGSVTASLTGPQGSGMLTSMAYADGLIAIPPGSGVITSGSLVEAIRFR